MKTPPHPDDLDFVPDVLAARHFGIGLRYRLILWATLLFFAAATLWAAFATLDEITRGNGKVVPSSKVQVIQNLEGGIVAEILVREGDTVDKDQPLMRLDDTRFASTYMETQHKYNELMARSRRLQAEADGQGFRPPDEVARQAPSLASNQRQLYAARQAELDSKVGILLQQKEQKQQETAELRARIDKLAGSHELARQELALSEPLMRQGAISPVEILRLQRNVNDLQGELGEARLALPRLESALREINRKIEQVRLDFRAKALTDLNEASAELAETQESLAALKDRVTRTMVRSPVHGIVKQIKVATIGGVVQPGMDLLEIVPLEDTLLIEARIKPSDIAFLHPGQPATVKITAYDFSIHGGLQGTLEHISADTITEKTDGGLREESHYRVLIRTQRNFLGSPGQPLGIMPGMTAEVDIKTGKKTVLQYLLKPVLKARERALREH